MRVAIRWYTTLAHPTGLIKGASSSVTPGLVVGNSAGKFRFRYYESRTNLLVYRLSEITRTRCGLQAILANRSKWQLYLEEH